MIYHRNEKIEEERRAARLHLHLHCAAALEGVAAADDESKIMCSKLGVIVRGIGVGITSRCQDCAALDAGL